MRAAGERVGTVPVQNVEKARQHNCLCWRRVVHAGTEEATSEQNFSESPLLEVILNWTVETKRPVLLLYQGCVRLVVCRHGLCELGHHGPHLVSPETFELRATYYRSKLAEISGNSGALLQSSLEGDRSHAGHRVQNYVPRCGEQPDQEVSDRRFQLPLVGTKRV